VAGTGAHAIAAVIVDQACQQVWIACIGAPPILQPVSVEALLNGFPELRFQNRGVATLMQLVLVMDIAAPGFLLWSVE